jgi:hypothetical protein
MRRLVLACALVWSASDARADDACTELDTPDLATRVKGDTVTLCGAERCVQLDLAKGRYHDSKAAPFDPPAREPVRDDRTYRVALGAEQNVFTVADARTGKELATVRPRVQRRGVEDCDDVQLLDGVVLVDQTQCAEEGRNRLLLFDPATGKELAAIGGKRPIDTWGSTWIRAHDHVWAFRSDDGQVVLQDVRTGKVIARHDARALFGIKRAPRRAVTQLVDLGATILVIIGTPTPGAAAILDKKTGAITRRIAPVCE